MGVTRVAGKSRYLGKKKADQLFLNQEGLHCCPQKVYVNLIISVIRDDTPVIRGMLHKVKHLVKGWRELKTALRKVGRWGCSCMN